MLLITIIWSALVVLAVVGSIAAWINTKTILDKLSRINESLGFREHDNTSLF